MDAEIERNRSVCPSRSRQAERRKSARRGGHHPGPIGVVGAQWHGGQGVVAGAIGGGRSAELAADKHSSERLTRVEVGNVALDCASLGRWLAEVDRDPCVAEHRYRLLLTGESWCRCQEGYLTR